MNLIVIFMKRTLHGFVVLIDRILVRTTLFPRLGGGWGGGHEFLIMVDSIFFIIAKHLGHHYIILPIGCNTMVLINQSINKPII